LLMVVVVISATLTLMTHVRGEDPKPPAQKVGVSSSELFVGAVPRAGDTEVTVLDVTYLPGAINPRHFHPAAVTFHVISGTPVFQEDDKAQMTLKPGDSLLIPAGTTHSHWNPSQTEGVRWLEFIVAEKGKGRSIRKP
ncbi:MAG: cupin domain-containing protein, partial [Burkholderiales bacterium]